jgi:hypothetical protein
MFLDVYKKGYSTLPNLRKLKPHEVFDPDRSNFEAIRKEKDEALANQNYFMEQNNDPYSYELCAEWIRRNYPHPLKSTSYLDIAKETQEDFLIHRIEGEKDWLSSAHVCFASHWKPEDKIGKSFNQIHQPVPMNLNNSGKLVEAMIHSGIFERFVWSVVYESKYNFHPRLEHKSFDKNDPHVLIKVERQVTVGFSEQKFCLFILRQYLVPEEKVDKKVLVGIIEKMSPEQKKYKGLDDCGDLISYLNS